AGQHGKAEFPPHPDRFFQALVAAWGRGGCDPKQRQALEWLEAQSAPTIHASESLDRPTLTVYSPTNDQLKAERNKEWLAASTVPISPTVVYNWSADPPIEIRQSLSDLARSVTYVGRSESLVRASIADPVTPNWIPDDATGNYLMRVSQAGRLADLEAAFQAGLRPQAAGWIGYRHASSTYLTGEWRTLIPFELVGAVDLRHCVRLAKAIRSCLLAACPDPVPEWVSGHSADGDRLRNSHVGIVPLANVGHSHADGRVLGIGILIPTGITAEQQLMAFQDFCREPQALGPQIMLRRAQSANLTLSATRWTTPSRAWGTVTPIACHRWPKRGQVRDIIYRDVQQANLPEPKSITVHATSPVNGGLFGEVEQAPKRFRAHATIEFDQPIAGPICVGAGRYLGLGFCLPVASSAVHSKPSESLA
ncbi:MAG: type I-U CRISPR-associated protein Cas5/Cas6, partial [Planctomycetales bacterium]|nr:type I-U CRISPR-associated protein Cas5/Cas6 [Planctomycetales bacterium]